MSQISDKRQTAFQIMWLKVKSVMFSEVVLLLILALEIHLILPKMSFISERYSQMTVDLCDYTTSKQGKYCAALEKCFNHIGMGQSLGI